MAEMTIQEERKAFDEQLDDLLATHRGEFALVKNGQIVDFYPNHEAAYTAGLSKFGLDAVFLIAPVEKTSPEPVSIAWESGVMFG